MEMTNFQNLFDYVEKAAETRPDAVAYTDGAESLTVGEVYRTAIAVAGALAGFGRRKPIAVFMERGPFAAAAMIGVLGSGNFYIPLDEELGLYRIQKILAETDPVAIVADTSVKAIVDGFGLKCAVIMFDEIKLEKLKQYIHVRSFERIRVKETVPYKIKRIKTSSLYKGETKIKTEGALGKRYVEYDVTYVNGVEESKTEISSETIKESKKQVLIIYVIYINTIVINMQYIFYHFLNIYFDKTLQYRREYR